jgi:hypothetical protein
VAADDSRVWSGRLFSPRDLDLIRQVIAQHPDATRSQLSHLVCAALDWRKPDGGLKDMRCRVVMLRMHEQGIIALPKPTKTLRVIGPTLAHIDPDTDPKPEIIDPVHQLMPLRIERFDTTNRQLSGRCNTFIQRYHYLGYQVTVGANLRYRVTAADGRELAYLVWGSAAWKTALRDHWIGWTEEQRRQRLHLIINNTRFLILPWVHSPNLASHVLGLMARIVPADWKQRFGYRPVLAETFVDSTRYTGHCYRTANWLKLGQTTGRSKWDRYTTMTVPKKDVWIYPLSKVPRVDLIGT